jgi:hypothetical protein
VVLSPSDLAAKLRAEPVLVVAPVVDRQEAAVLGVENEQQTIKKD